MPEELAPGAAGLLLLLAAPAAPFVRAAVTAAAAGLLYPALTAPGERLGGPARSVARRLFFAALGGLVMLALTARWTPVPEGNRGRGFRQFTEGVYTYRMTFGPLSASASRQQAVRRLQAAAEQIPESAYIARYLGIARAEQGRYPEALNALLRAADVLARRAPERAGAEREVWRRLFGPETPSVREVVASRGRIEAWGLGWIGRVALLAGFRRAGAAHAARETQAALSREASGQAQALLGAGVLLVVVVPQLALIVLVVGAVLVGTRLLRRVPRDPHPVAPVLWEAFILMLALSVAPATALFGGRLPAPETRPELVALLLLSQDGLHLLAVLYLWRRLKAHGLSLAEIGLSTRHLGANLAVGIAGGLVAIPLALVVGLATQALSDRFFPGIAPPYHPLEGLTATSTSPFIRGALFGAAVVGAPVLEEVFFRGALFGVLRRRFRLWAALAASSLFFAALHPQLPLGFLPIAALGAAFAGLYEWRQSLVPAMVAHAMNNAHAFLWLSLLFPPSR